MYEKQIRRIALPQHLAHVAGAFWHPTEPFLKELAEFLRGKRVLEVFGGNGYLGALLQAMGVQVTVTSILSGMDAHEQGIYTDVIDMKASHAVDEYGSEHDVLLMCWPTVTLDAARCAIDWEAQSSRDIVYIGEVTDRRSNQLGGCACDEFFELFVPHTRFKTYKGSSIEAALVGRMRRPGA